MRTKHIMCTPLTSAHSKPGPTEAAGHDVTDLGDCLLLYDERSHWCSSELVMIHLQVLKGSADPQDEVKSYSLWLGYAFTWIGHAVKYLLEMGLAAL